MIGPGITRHNDVKGEFDFSMEINAKVFVLPGYCLTEMYIKNTWIIYQLEWAEMLSSNRQFSETCIKGTLSSFLASFWKSQRHLSIIGS